MFLPGEVHLVYHFLNHGVILVKFRKEKKNLKGLLFYFFLKKYWTVNNNF